MLIMQMMAHAQSKKLTACHLDKIDNFERYEGVISDLQTRYIRFHVKYKDGSRGYVYAGLSISGESSSETQLREIQCKIRAAKALLADTEWDYLEGKYGVERDKPLVLCDGLSLG